MVVLSQNLMRSALWLILAFFGIAGLFVLLQAEFLAVMQVLVYVGAISTLIIFAIMLSRNFMDPTQPRFNDQWGLVGGFAALLFVGLAAVVTRVAWPVAGRCSRRLTPSSGWGSTLWPPTWCPSRWPRCCWWWP